MATTDGTRPGRRRPAGRSPGGEDDQAPGLVSLGAPARRGPEDLNRFSPWRYLLILVVLVLGCLYAAPTSFRPITPSRFPRGGTMPGCRSG